MPSSHILNTNEKISVQDSDTIISLISSGNVGHITVMIRPVVKSNPV